MFLLLCRFPVEDISAEYVDLNGNVSSEWLMGQWSIGFTLVRVPAGAALHSVNAAPLPPHPPPPTAVSPK